MVGCKRQPAGPLRQLWGPQKEMGGRKNENENGEVSLYAMHRSSSPMGPLSKGFPALCRPPWPPPWPNTSPKKGIGMTSYSCNSKVRIILHGVLVKVVIDPWFGGKSVGLYQAIYKCLPISPIAYKIVEAVQWWQQCNIPMIALLVVVASTYVFTFQSKPKWLHNLVAIERNLVKLPFWFIFFTVRQNSNKLEKKD